MATFRGLPQWDFKHFAAEGQPSGNRSMSKYWRKISKITQNEIDQQLLRLNHLEKTANLSAEKANIFEKMGYIKKKDADAIRKEAEEAKTIVADVKKKTIAATDEIKKAQKKVFDGIGTQGNVTFAQDAMKDTVETAKKTLAHATVKAQKMEIEFKKATDSLFDIDLHRQEMEKQLNIAKAAGASEEEINALEREVESATKETEKAESMVRRAKRMWNIASDATIEASGKLDTFIEDLKGLEGESGISKAALYPARVAGRQLEELVAPYQKALGALKKSGDMLINGYKDFAKSLIEGDMEASEFYAKIRGEMEGASEKEAAVAERELAELNELVKGGAGEEEILAFAAAKISPSYRYWVSNSSTWAKIGEEYEASEGLGFVMALPRWGVSGLAGIASTLTQLVVYPVARVSEVLIGEVATAALYDLGVAGLEVAGAVLSFGLSIEVQAILFGLWSARDAVKKMNVWKWMDDNISWIVPASVIDTFTTLRMHEYPDESIQVKGGKDTNGISSAEKIDADMQKEIVDFWAKLYIDELREMGHKYPEYTPMKPYKMILRVPGKYINLKHHPFDSNEEIKQCQDLEDSLDTGRLVDANGHLNMRDKGGQLVSSTFPKKKGYVRNLVQFPLYENTVVWPDRKNGTVTQTQGSFTPSNLDPTIVKTLLTWAEQGTWGAAYNMAPNEEIRKVAIETNRKDYQQFLKPSLNDPYISTGMNEWLKNNRGKRAVMGMQMFSIRLDVLEKEMNNPAQNDVGFWVKLGIPRRAVVSTADYIEIMYKETGRYPLDTDAMGFYKKVVYENKEDYIKYIGGPNMPLTPIIATRKPSPSKVMTYNKVIVDSKLYLNALREKKGNIEEAVRLYTINATFDAYIHDNRMERQPWDYVEKNKEMFLGELQSVALVNQGKRKKEVWAAYQRLVANIKAPLNTDSFHRTFFVGRLNQLVYSRDKAQSSKIESELERVMGKIHSRKLISTGITSKDLISWAEKMAEKMTLVSPGWDIPAEYGHFHAQVIVVDKPSRTMFIVFGSDGGPWNIPLRVDFFSASVNSVVPGKTPGDFVMKKHSEKDKNVQSPEQFVYGDPNNFLIHDGFYRVWKAMSSAVNKQVKEEYTSAQSKGGISNVIVTGYSLGAAIAQIAALEIPSNPSVPDKSVLHFGHTKAPATVYTRPHAYMYASPAIGDIRFSHAYKSMTSESVNIYTDSDAVTMLPPFLIPGKEWPSQKANAIRDFKLLVTKGGGYKNNTIAMVDVLLGETGIHVAPALLPSSWLNPDFSFSWRKVFDNIKSGVNAMNTHRSVRGGSTFIRLNPYEVGDFVENPYDPGSSETAIRFSMQAKNRKVNSRKLHGLDLLMENFQEAVKRHPDLFSIISDKLPTWSHGGKISPDDPGKLHPIIPSVQRYLEKGAVIGLAHTTVKYEPWQIVDKKDVDKERLVPIPFSFAEAAAEYGIRKRRREVAKTDPTYVL